MSRFCPAPRGREGSRGRSGMRSPASSAGTTRRSSEGDGRGSNQRRDAPRGGPVLGGRGALRHRRATFGRGWPARVERTSRPARARGSSRPPCRSSHDVGARVTGEGGANVAVRCARVDNWSPRVGLRATVRRGSSKRGDHPGSSERCACRRAPRATDGGEAHGASGSQHGRSSQGCRYDRTRSSKAADKRATPRGRTREASRTSAGARRGHSFREPTTRGSPDRRWRGRGRSRRRWRRASGCTPCPPPAG